CRGDFACGAQETSNGTSTPSYKYPARANTRSHGEPQGDACADAAAQCTIDRPLADDSLGTPFDGGALLSEGDAGISAGRGREDERWIPSDILQASSHRTGERLDGIDDRVEASRAEQIEPVLRAG